jgi:hypothetical protein
VQHVHLVHGEQVDVALDLPEAEEVPRHVEHGPAPGEPGLVGDVDAGDGPRPVLDGARLHARRQQLPQGLHGVEEPGRGAAGQDHLTGRDVEPVPLSTESWAAPPGTAPARAAASARTATAATA